MYREQYVAAVMRSGKIQPEDRDGVIVLPFESEYQIRIKNKSRKRAVADIHIDGRLAVRGVVIDPLGSVDLERFLEGFSLDCGPRFKLVKASDSRVSQPGDSENGIVSVNFYAEKDQPKVVEEHRIVHDHCTHRHPHCYHGNCPDCCPWCHRPFWYGSNILRSCEDKSFTTYGQSVSGGGTQGMTLNAGNDVSVTPTSGVDVNLIQSSLSNQAITAKKLDANINASYTSSPVNAEPAATVEGSHSTQQFRHTYIDVDRDHPVTIQLKLRGVVQLIQQCDCGFKRTDESYCPKCGKHLAIAA